MRKLNNSLLKILLQAELDSGSVSKIQEQITKIQAKAKPTKIIMDTSGATLSMSQLSRAIDDASKLERDWGMAIKMRANEHHAAALKINKSIDSDVNKIINDAVRLEKDWALAIKMRMNEHHAAALKANSAMDKDRNKIINDAIRLEKDHALAIRMRSNEAHTAALKVNKSMDVAKNKEIKDAIRLEKDWGTAIKMRMNEHHAAALKMDKAMDSVKNSNIGMQSLLGTVQKFAMFAGINLSIYGLFNAIKNGAKEVKELDTAMVELKKVTNETDKTYAQFMDTAFSVGKELSRTGKEVINASASFARMGFSIKESADLAYEALLMLNVGDGINNLDDATSAIIATLKGFQVETDNTAKATRHINDVYNEIANNFATSTGDIAEGVKKTSAVMNQAGNSFEQTVALFTGGFEVMQDSSKVSSGLNIIAQRLKAIDENGETIEGLAPKLEEAFGKLGLSLYDTNGELKSTYDNLESLAKIYPSLSKAQQNYIGELVSGKRQAVVLQSILGNWESIEDVITATGNAAGSAMEENEKYLDSIEGKTKQLTSTLQMFWKNLIDSDFIKTVVDSGTKLIEIMDFLANNVMAKAIAQTVLLAGAWKLATIGASKFGETVLWVTAQQIYATVAAKGLTAGLLTLGKAALVSPFFWIPVAIMGFSWINNKIKENTVSLEEQKEVVKTLSSEISSLQSEYDKLMDNKDRTENQERYLALLEAEIENKKKSLQLSAEIAMQDEFFKKSNSQYAYNSSGEEKALQNLRELIDLEAELGKAKTVDERGKIEEEIIKARETSIEILKTLKDYEDKLGVLPQSLLDLKNAIEEVIIAEDDLIKTTREQDDATIGSQQSIEALTKTFEESASKLEAYKSILEELTSKEGLSAKSKDNIVTKYQEFLPYLSDENELRQQLIIAMAREEQAKRDAYNKMLSHNEKYFNTLVEKNGWLRDTIKEYGIDQLEDVKTLAKAKLAIELELIRSLSSYWSKYYNSVYKTMVFPDADTEQAFYNSAEGQRYYATKRGLLELENLSGSIDFSGSKSVSKGSKSSSSSSSTKEQYKAESDAYAKINQELDRNNVLLAKNKTLQDLAGDDIAKKIKLMEEEIELNKDRQDLLSQYNTQMREEAKSLQKDLSSIFNFKGSWDDNSMIITNLEAIEGKGEVIDKKYKRILEIIKELPKASQDWWVEQLKNEASAENIAQLSKDAVAERLSNSKDWIDKRKFYDDWGADNEIAAWERVKSYIGQYYTDGIINHKEYADYMLEIDKNLANERQRIADEQKRLDEERTKKQQELALYLVNQEIESLERKRKTVQENADKRIKAIETTIKLLQERIEIINKEEEEIKKLQDTSSYIVSQEIENIQRQKDAIKELYDTKILAIQNEIDRLQEKNDLLKEEEDRQKRLLEIADQKNRLENTLKEKNVRIFQDGQWSWVADPKAVAQETENLKKLQEGYAEWESDLAKKKEIEALQSQIDILKSQLTLEEEHYDTQIFNLQEFVKEHSRLTNEFYGAEVLGLEGLINSVKAIESDSYDERMSKLSPFLDQYLRITKQSRLDQLTSDKKSTEDAIKEHNKRIESIRQETERTNEQYNKQITNLQDFITQYNEQTNEFYGQQIEGMSALLETIKNVETGNYGDRLTQLGKFVSDYLNLASQANVSLGGSSSNMTNDEIKAHNDRLMKENEGFASSIAGTSAGNGFTYMKTPSGGVATVNNNSLEKYLKNGYSLKHDGGIVGGSNRDLPEVVNKLFNTKPNEQMVKALKGELFIPEENIFKNFLPNMQSLLNMSIPKLPQMSLSKSSSVPSNVYHVQIDKIETPDAQSFVEFLPSLVKQYK